MSNACLCPSRQLLNAHANTKTAQAELKDVRTIADVTKELKEHQKRVEDLTKELAALQAKGDPSTAKLQNAVTIKQHVFDSLVQRFNNATEEEQKAHQAIDAMITIAKKRKRESEGGSK